MYVKISINCPKMNISKKRVYKFVEKKVRIPYTIMLDKLFLLLKQFNKVKLKYSLIIK